jgi:hypothetical protein
MNLTNNQFTNFVGKAANRISTVAREARDVPTAIANAVVSKSPYSVSQIGNQISEVGKAAMTGQPQTTAPFTGRKDGWTNKDLSSNRKNGYTLFAPGSTESKAYGSKNTGPSGN